MRVDVSRTRTFARILGLVVLLRASDRSEAHGVISQGPNDFLRSYPVYPEWSFQSCCVVIPRTYPYHYQPRCNQPLDYRVVGSDGKTYWRSRVRDIPMRIH
jgi:hypothetical protein